MNTANETFESPNRKLAQVIQYMIMEMGINPSLMYCQITGKPIARLDTEELIPFVENDMDVDAIADDLFTRVIASMRPSMHWNVMREDSIDRMAKMRPIETLAYLLNRLFQPVEYYKLPLARRLDDQHMRIKMYDFLTTADSDKLRVVYDMLIEIDAKMNLTQQQIDLRPVDFMLFFDDSMETIKAFYADCMKRWARNQKNEEDSRRWFKGNTGARPAFFTAFMEAKPETKKETKVRVKKEKDKELDALWDAVMTEATPEPEPSVPAPTTPAVKPSAPSFIKAKPVTPVHVGKMPSFLRSK